MDINNHPVPFYMTYPLPLYFEEERRRAREAEYLKSMYPADARKIQGIVENAMQILDYEGSMIYDEYPDRWQMYKLAQDILERIKRQEAKDNPGAEIPKEKWEWASDMVQIILFYEVYKRRHNNHSGILKF